MLHHRPGRRLQAPVPRRRSVALAAGVCGLSIMLVAALALSAEHLLHRPSPATATAAARGSVLAAAQAPHVSAAVARTRDELAARPMPDTGTGDEFGWPQVSTRDPGPAIVLPAGQRVDALGVALGLPETPEGALAQLASIDSAAMQSASLPGVRAVITAWAAPGGPTSRSWSEVSAMASLLQDADLSGAGSPALRIHVTPAMGLIKGRVGAGFVVACVDFSVDVTYGDTTTSASADCQRMLWQDGRWLIGPGREPATPDQVWPDTDAAFAAGFRDLTHP